MGLHSGEFQVARQKTVPTARHLIYVAAMRKFLVAASLAGATAVGAGAFGAHGLKDLLTENNMLSTWNTAVLYNLTHALALLTVGMQRCDLPASARTWLIRAAQSWLVGIVLFSGSLYGLALGGPKLLGPITPLGGLFLISGWIWVGVGAFKMTPKA